MRLYLRAFLVIVSLLSGCAAITVILSPIVKEADKQEIKFIQGDEVIISYGNSSTVSLSGRKDYSEQELQLFLTVENRSQQDFIVDPEKITMECYRKAINQENGKQETKIEILQIISPEKYIVDYQKRVSAAKISNELGEIGALINPYQTELNQTNRQLSQNLQRDLIVEGMKVADLAPKLMRKHTLGSGESIAGIVLINYKYGEKYRVTINIGVDIHSFEFIPKEIGVSN